MTVNKMENMTKNIFKNYIKTTCTPADPGENVQNLKKTGIKLYEEMRSQYISYLYTFIESEVRKRQPL